MRLMALLLLLLPFETLAQSRTLPDGRPVSSVQISIPVFHQTISTTYPFDDLDAVVDFQEIVGDRQGFIAEWVPEGETVHNWTQMLTITGYNQAASHLSRPAANVLVGALIQSLTENYRRGCQAVDIQPLRVERPVGTRAVDAVFLACNQVTGARHGEAMVAIAVVGTQDLYSLQWAERFPGGQSPVPDAIWQARLQSLAASRFCDPPAGSSRPPVICN